VHFILTFSMFLLLFAICYLYLLFILSVHVVWHGYLFCELYFFFQSET